MIELNVVTYLIICPLVFLAAVVDSIAGGGGLITLPAYMAVGLPAPLAAGTNKFSSAVGTSVSVLRFFKNGKLHLKAALLSAAFALPGSFLGAQLAMMLGDTLKYIIIGSLPFAAIAGLIKKRDTKEEGNLTIKIAILCGLIGLFVGMYDGLAGPGTGTFLIIGYTALCGFALRESSGTAKVVNFSSNIAALIAFASRGNVLYALAIPAALCGIAGHYIGSGLAIKKGGKVIKPMLYGVVVLIVIKIIYDLVVQ